MSDSSTKAGPALAADIQEVQAVFASDAALQDAIGRLRAAGFDHAELSLPHASPAPGRATPEQGADDPLGDDDTRQVRTMQTSMAGTVGAFAAAAATVATGGAAALVVGAAAVAGLGAGAVAHSIGDAQHAVQHDARQDAAARGELVLAVRTTDDARRGRAEALMQAAGATKVAAVRRTDAAIVGIDAAGWTG